MRLPEHILDHFLHPRNAGKWPDDIPRITTGLAGLPGLSETVRLQLSMNETGRLIRAARFMAHGSAFTIAVASWFTEQLENCSRETAAQMKPDGIVDELRLPASQVHCADLVIMALQKALENYPPL